jgi:hypothetical protein
MNSGGRWTQWYGLALVGLLYGLSFPLPAVVVHGQITGVKVDGRAVDDRPEPLHPTTLDGRSCFTWGLDLARPAWFANPVFWAACSLFALRKWAWAGLLALVAVALGLAEAAPDLCGYRPPGQGGEYLIGYWLWLSGMAMLAAFGLVGWLGVCRPNPQISRVAEVRAKQTSTS